MAGRLLSIHLDMPVENETKNLSAIQDTKLAKPRFFIFRKQENPELKIAILETSITEIKTVTIPCYGVNKSFLSVNNNLVLGKLETLLELLGSSSVKVE